MSKKPRVESADNPYQVEEGRICFIKSTTDGPVSMPLCNFDARVREEVAIDDGVEKRLDFLIDGTLSSGKVLPQARVSAGRFAGMQWVPTSWGMDAIVRAGQAMHDRLREAIQVLSPNTPKRTVFAHTGWKVIGDRWHYLSSTGAVGADGFEVDLGQGLSKYALPREPRDPTAAMRASLDLLGVASPSVTIPLWAGVFRAPLAAALPLDLAMWVEGITGSLKSTIAALFLAHYGAFDRTSLPGNWSSTANSLEKRAFTLKDALFVVDDYAPTGADRKELEGKAARLLRAQGNLAGRARLTSDLSERAGYPPRGLILGTGEQRPSGRSILARTLFLELDRQMISIDQLNVSQSVADMLPHALAGYVQWLAPQMPALGQTLAESFRQARSRACTASSHLRIAEALAHLWVGLDCGLSYAEEVGACTTERASEIRAEGWKALVQRASAQGLVLEEERPVRIYLQILATLVTQKRAHLLPKDQAIQGDIGERPTIGWYDSDHLYLLPEAAYQVVSRFSRESGELFPVPENTLRRDLVRDGVAVTGQGRRTVVQRVGGASHRVLQLRLTGISAILGTEFPVPLPLVTGVTGSGE